MSLCCENGRLKFNEIKTKNFRICFRCSFKSLLSFVVCQHRRKQNETAGIFKRNSLIHGMRLLLSQSIILPATTCHSLHAQMPMRFKSINLLLAVIFGICLQSWLAESSPLPTLECCHCVGTMERVAALSVNFHKSALQVCHCSSSAWVSDVPPWLQMKSRKFSNRPRRVNSEPRRSYRNRQKRADNLHWKRMKKRKLEDGSPWFNCGFSLV